MIGVGALAYMRFETPAIHASNRQAMEMIVFHQELPSIAHDS